VAEVRKAGAKSESLRIGYSSSLVGELMSPALRRVRQEFPRAQIELVDRPPGQLGDALEAGAIDLAFGATLGAIVGFAIMMVFDIALG
jgi:DNA-binding transcriptional LysR family regulator